MQQAGLEQVEMARAPDLGTNFDVENCLFGDHVYLGFLRPLPAHPRRSAA
jgi:hypothetical protein